MIPELFTKEWYKNKILISVLLIVVIVTSISIFFLTWSRQGYHNSFALAYEISPRSIEERTLSVTVKITPQNQSAANNFFTFIKNAPITDFYCRDSSNKTINLVDKEGLIRIGPFRKDAFLTYTAVTGNPGKLGLQGAFYNDMITFSGENVLIFPYFNPGKDINNIGKIIQKLSIRIMSGNNNWDLIIPYQTTKGYQQNQIVINKPDWMSFFNLGKSCFAFGKFEKITLKRKLGNLEILLDPAYKNQFSKIVENAIANLYDFYADLFGEGLENYPIVLLRQDPGTNLNIISGVGGKSMGFSLNPDMENDWRSLAHSMYHAFFDSKVKARNLHFNPNIWFYRGLATYYENLSIDALPQEIKTKFGFNVNAEYRTLYTRYLYFRLTEPSFFNLIPMDEADFYQAQSEFMDYTQGPLLINAIETLSLQTGKHNQLLRYVLKHADNNSININKALAETLGPDSLRFKKKFISGKEQIPFTGQPDNAENPDKVVKALNDYQYIMYTWFRYENVAFPLEPIMLLPPDKVMNETNLRSIKFGPPEFESMVKSYSPTLFILLKQQALRANVCGLNFSDPKLREELISNEKYASKWEDFLKTFLPRSANNNEKQSTTQPGK